MKNRDLQAIIRDMAARLEVHHQPGDDHISIGLLNEVEAFMAVDSTLARLYKEFMDARRTRVRALEQQGENSALADIARDLEESAQSAMETRMIELREDRVKSVMAERLMAQAHMEEMGAYRAASADRYAEQQAQSYASYREEEALMAQRQHEGADSFMTLMMMWWMMRQMVRRTQVRLSLANSFARALESTFDRDFAASAA